MSIGLYHLARQVDTINELEQARKVLAEAGARTGESSHGATKSVYGADPDGNEFEIMWMLPREDRGEYENAAPIDRLDPAAVDEPGRWAGAAILYGTLPFDAGVPTTPGRLSGVPVLVAQGDYDTVIPRELMDRTWDYVRGESGATATTRRDPVGHGIAPEALAELAHWLTSASPASVARPGVS